MSENEIIPRLSFGNWQAAKHHLDRSDRYVVTVAVDAPVKGHRSFNLIDGPGNNPTEFREAVFCVVDAHRRGENVFVHCVSGRSRSGAVVVGALRELEAKSLCEAYDYAKAKRPETAIHPHLSAFLLTQL